MSKRSAPRTRPIEFNAELAVPDLQRLNDLAQRNPRGHEARILRATITQLENIAHGYHSTHQLTFLPTYPDLSDCHTTYVGDNPDTRPSHRIVWKETIDNPADPRSPARRDIIAVGRRERGEVYFIAGQRLGRPIGRTLEELRELPEPISHAQRTRDHTPAPRNAHVSHTLSTSYAGECEYECD